MIDTNGTPARSGIERAAGRSGGQPLAVLSAAMLAAAGAFFCYAMPQRVLDATLGTLGIAGPVGGVGRLLFLLAFAGIAALLGWLAVTIAGGGAATARPARDSTGEAMMPAFPPGTIEGAPPPIAMRGSDGHPDAPPRRPIFADHDLAAAMPARENPRDARVTPAEQAPAEPLSLPEAPQPPEAAVLPESEQSVASPEAAAAPLATPEPLDVIEAGPAPADAASDPADPSETLLATQMVAMPAPAEERTIAALMARLERGLEEREGNLPPPPTPEEIAALHDAPPGEDTLRTAIDALHRIAGRPR